MSGINVNKIIMDNSLELKKKYPTLDCIVFRSHADANTNEGVAEIYSSYNDYNSQVTDKEWDDVYETCFPILDYLEVDYGKVYTILVDLKKKEVRFSISNDEFTTLSFSEFVKIKD